MDADGRNIMCERTLPSLFVLNMFEQIISYFCTYSDLNIFIRKWTYKCKFINLGGKQELGEKIGQKFSKDNDRNFLMNNIHQKIKNKLKWQKVDCRLSAKKVFLVFLCKYCKFSMSLLQISYACTANAYCIFSMFLKKLLLAKFSFSMKWERSLRKFRTALVTDFF